MTNSIKAGEDCYAFLQQNKNFRVLEILYASKRPLKFDDILRKYGPNPPIATISLSIYEGKNLGLIATTEVKSGKSEKASTSYRLTDLGKRLLLESQK